MKKCNVVELEDNWSKSSSESKKDKKKSQAERMIEMFYLNIPIKKIADNLKVPYSNVYTELKKFVDDGILTQAEYDIYKKESKKHKPMTGHKLEIFNLLTSGVEPMRIIDTVPVARQYVYACIKEFIDRGLITEEDFEDIKATTTRKKTEKSRAKEENMKKVLDAVSSGKYNNFNEILEKLEIPATKRYAKELFNKGLIEEDLYNRMKEGTRVTRQDKILKVVEMIQRPLPEIAEELGVCLTTVYTYLKRAKDDKIISNKVYRSIVAPRQTQTKKASK